MSFSVCVVCKEIPRIVDRFSKYYLDKGAEKVTIYLDEGSPEVKLSNHPKVEILKCSELLENLGILSRPQFIEELQMIVYHHAFETLLTEWLLVCDIDEFVGYKDDINRALSQIPPEWQFAVLPVAEAIWGPNDKKYEEFGCTFFRTRTRKGFGKMQSSILYGKSGKYTVAGLVGHSLGKYFIRKTAAVKTLGIHQPIGEATLRGGPTTDIEGLTELYLYHFDAISFDRWNEKWSGRLKKTRASNAFDFNKATASYALSFSKATSQKEKMVLFKSLYEINKFQAMALKAMGQLRREFLFPGELQS